PHDGILCGEFSRGDALAALVLVLLGLAIPLGYGANWLGLLLFASVLAGLALTPPLALAMALALGAATAILGWLIGAPDVQELSTSLLTVLVGVVSIVVTALLRITGQLIAARAEVERLAVAAERGRLALDLHDTVKQQLFAAGMELGTGRALAQSDPAGAAKHLRTAQEAVQGAARELAALIDGGGPPALRERSLPQALRTEVRDFSERTGIGVRLGIDPAGQAVPAEPARQLLRITQEALSNVARHSAARTVALTLDVEQDTLRLCIADDGSGLCAHTPHGHGLAGMHARARALGGSLQVRRTSASGGTTILLRCPRECAAGATGYGNGGNR
ncbi:MAG: sensor histidine kinase, partial [Sciscionella sp.]